LGDIFSEIFGSSSQRGSSRPVRGRDIAIQM